ncbi:MAG TPA: GNAT family N-acetyltransferase, partial [Woeseiaceae bacterium]|nr:GNAT family N-acetyltransferase [Woeseiaceae bacterium]
MPAADGEALAGVVALQPFSAVGLLRSLVVAQAARSAGCGSKLVQAVERTAARSGVRQLWLLTTGAEHYFEKLGFLATSRALAPPEIRQTAEFTSLCPDSAVLMCKSLQP